MPPTVLKARKGEETRAQILEAAVQQASEAGFESLTIGTLAQRTGLSKSGLFAHFGSRSDLQVAALDEAARRFTEIVFLPALKAPRGLARLRAIVDRFVGWTERAGLKGGCPIQAASAEYDDIPGPMRDAVAERQRTLARELARAVQMAVETGELAADTDPRQFVFELYGIVLAYYHTGRLIGDDTARTRAMDAFERLVASYAPSLPAARRR
jgi:AcrR family transcriptional regulator